LPEDAAVVRGPVGIGQTARPQTGQDVFEPVRLEADQFESETVEFEITQLTAEQIGVPARPRRKFVVGQAIGLLLLFAPAARDDHRDGRQLQLCPCRNPPMPGDQHALLVNQDRIRPPPFADGFA
jgi:hypothetical protein